MKQWTPEKVQKLQQQATAVAARLDDAAATVAAELAQLEQLIPEFRIPREAELRRAFGERYASLQREAQDVTEKLAAAASQWEPANRQRLAPETLSREDRSAWIHRLAHVSTGRAIQLLRDAIDQGDVARAALAMERLETDTADPLPLQAHRDLTAAFGRLLESDERRTIASAQVTMLRSLETYQSVHGAQRSALERLTLGHQLESLDRLARGGGRLQPFEGTPLPNSPPDPSLPLTRLNAAREGAAAGS